MSTQLLGRRKLFLTVAEYCAATGEKPNTVRKRIRRGDLPARDLSAGTGRRPRYRIPMRELRKRGEK